MKTISQTARNKSRTNAAFQREQTRLHGRCDARSMAPKTPKHFGVLAGCYLGQRGSKNGVPL